MALFKENYENRFGISTQYWKITGININSYYKWCDIEVKGFYNKETRDANKEPLERENIRAKWTDDEFEMFFSSTALEGVSIYTKAYEYVKTKEFFTDCIDIL
jgi:hypothetical protein